MVFLYSEAYTSELLTTMHMNDAEMLYLQKVDILGCLISRADYSASELPLIRTPEMWPPLYSGHFENAQSMLYSTNSPLK